MSLEQNLLFALGAISITGFAEWCQIFRLNVSEDTEFETVLKGGFAE